MADITTTDPTTITTAPNAVGEVPPLDRSDAARDRDDARRDRRRTLTMILGRLGVGVGFLGIWEFVSGRVFNEFFLSRPTAIAGRIVELSASGELLDHLRVTMLETGLGLIIGMTLGVFLGLFIATSKTVGQWFYPYIIALYSLPRVALAPLFIVWFGIGLSSKVMMVITMVVFVAFYNVYEGVRNIDDDLLQMGRSYRLTRVQSLRHIVLPSIMPWLLTALRLAIGLGLIGAVIAELIGSSVGLGFYIKNSANLFDTTGVFAGLVVITIIAMLLEQIVAYVERRVTTHR